jgi:hypothetical protein
MHIADEERPALVHSATVLQNGGTLLPSGKQTFWVIPSAVREVHLNSDGQAPAAAAAAAAAAASMPKVDAGTADEDAVDPALAQLHLLKVPSIKQTCLPVPPLEHAHENSTPGSVQGLEASS